MPKIRIFLKKHGSLIGLICFLILMIVLVVTDDKGEKIKGKDNEPKKSVKEVNNDNPMERKNYEDIIRNFYEAKNHAIETNEKVFLDHFLEKGGRYTKKVMDDVERKNKAKYEAIIFKEIKSVKKNIHTVVMEVVNGSEKKDVIFKIKSQKGSYYLIIGEEDG
jgi:hypothetical protein